MNKFYVYEHWRLDRDECFYVGKGSGRRAYDLKYRNRHHKAIVAKLNRTGSGMEVRMVATGLAEKEAFNLEIDRICFWVAAGVDLANITSGGEGTSGFNHTAETIAKISSTQKGRPSPIKGIPKSAEHKKNMAEAIRNREITDEYRSKMASKAAAQWEAKRQAGTAFIPPETRAKMSAVKLGKKKSEETKARMSAARLGEKRGPQKPEHVAARVQARKENAERRGAWNLRDTVKT